jgi:DNA-directed RNA polymerase sigma subunit (sigma70/sigma32)
MDDPTLDPAPFLVAARRRARLVFAKRHDRAELIADAVSVAWELVQTAPPQATPQSVAWYATKRVKVGRQFSERQRSITGPNPRRLNKPARDEEWLTDVLDDSQNPAELAQVHLDFVAWLDVLTDRERAMLAAFMNGERTSTLAARYGISHARVSQIRRELVDHWAVFTE